MKVSASLYSGNPSKKVETLIELEDIGIDAIHLDCKDDPLVFEDFSTIRKNCSAIIDLHLITSNPERYFDAIQVHQPDWLTLQYENLTNTFDFKKIRHSNWGLAICPETPISVFEKVSDEARFLLLMTTIPGESGGTFNPNTFQKIREAQKRFPKHRIHVDGGVNHEVAFILRDMGVYCSVSGNYLMKSQHTGRALHTLKSGIETSKYLVKDFMLTYAETPVCLATDNFESLLYIMDSAKLGFVCIINDDNTLAGICSNADLRRGLLKNVKDLNNTTLKDITNTTPLTANENWSIAELIDSIQEASFPVLFLPVVNNENKLTGAVTFNQLIKSNI